MDWKKSLEIQSFLRVGRGTFGPRLGPKLVDHLILRLKLERPWKDIVATSSFQSIIAKGKMLDEMAFWLGFKRKKYFLFFRESDRSLRERMAYHFRYVQKIKQSQNRRTDEISSRA